MYTAYPPLSVRDKSVLEQPGVDVRDDHEFGDRDQCDWCADVDAVCTVRVYRTERMQECCRACAPSVIHVELDARSDWDVKDIVVEVATESTVLALAVAA
jgi:hypothetical protein